MEERIRTMNRRATRQIGISIIAMSCICFSSWASATIYYVTGTVELIMAQDSGFGPNSDWFSLNGVGPQGGCPSGGGTTSNMAIALKDDGNGSRQYAFILAAFTQGLTLTVRVEDTNKNGPGQCYAEFMW
jgi:hypothetical protein